MSKTGGMFDASLELRASGQAAITATTEESPIALDGVSQEDFKAVVNVESAPDHTTGDETYQIDILASNTSGGTFVVVGSLFSAEIVAKGAGQYEIALSGGRMNSASAGAPLFIKVKATLGGTTPILTYNAFLTRSYF